MAGVFSDGKPRIIQIKGINMEAELGPNMLYVTNRDRPGLIGRLGTLLGDAGLNIATFHLVRAGRRRSSPSSRSTAACPTRFWRGCKIWRTSCRPSACSF